MAYQQILAEEDDLASVRIEVAGASVELLDQSTPKEIILGESLLTAGLQTSIRYQSYMHVVPPRNIDDFKDDLKTLITFKFQKFNYDIANFVK